MGRKREIIIFDRIKPNEMSERLFIFGLGGQEILFIALIVLILFGGKKIPELMKGLGKGVKSFKDGMNGIDEDTKSDDKENR